MKMAGEAGSLLKIEEELADAISAARKLWVTEPKARQQRLFVDQDEKAVRQLAFDLSGVTDEQFWREAESLVLGVMQQYAGGADNGSGFRRRLFADDAEHGFAFVDLCRQRYDVVLMNPPFGLVPANAYAMLCGWLRRCAQRCIRRFCPQSQRTGSRWAGRRNYVLVVSYDSSVGAVSTSGFATLH